MKGGFMNEESMKEIFEKSQVVITPEERETRRILQKKRMNELKEQGIHQDVLCKIVRARIGDISQFQDNLQLYVKEHPFKSSYFRNIGFGEPYLIYNNLIRFNLELHDFSPFSQLGTIDVQLIEKNSKLAVITVRKAGDLQPLLKEGYAFLLYDDSVQYLIEISKWLQSIYGKGHPQPLYESPRKPGRETNTGYDEAFQKIRIDHFSEDEAFRYWQTNFQEEVSNLINPRKRFRDAMGYRRRKLKN